MPMIDVYAAAALFPDNHELARDLAQAVMRWEQVPDADRIVSEQLMALLATSQIGSR